MYNRFSLLEHQVRSHEKVIFHYPDKVIFSTFVTGDDLKQLLTLDWINISCVHIWIRYLHKKVVLSNVEEVVGFFCPQRLGFVVSCPQKLTSYLSHSMSKQRTKQYILAPFIENRHWMLIVICVQRGEALFFNSLEVGLETIKVKGSLSVTLNLNNGSRRSLTWKVVKCPRDLDNLKDMNVAIT